MRLRLIVILGILIGWLAVPASAATLYTFSGYVIEPCDGCTSRIFPVGDRFTGELWYDTNDRVEYSLTVDGVTRTRTSLYPLGTDSYLPWAKTQPTPDPTLDYVSFFGQDDWVYWNFVQGTLPADGSLPATLNPAAFIGGSVFVNPWIIGGIDAGAVRGVIDSFQAPEAPTWLALVLGLIGFVWFRESLITSDPRRLALRGRVDLK